MVHIPFKTSAKSEKHSPVSKLMVQPKNHLPRKTKRDRERETPKAGPRTAEKKKKKKNLLARIPMGSSRSPVLRLLELLPQVVRAGLGEGPNSQTAGKAIWGLRFPLTLQGKPASFVLRLSFLFWGGCQGSPQGNPHAVLGFYTHIVCLLFVLGGGESGGSPLKNKTPICSPL